MGLLDNLGNLSPEQTQGLLGFASSMLQAGGPSLKPTSFGQALGGGLTAFNTTMNAERQRKLEEDQLRQIAEMRGLQIQGMAGDLQDKALARQQQLAAQKVAQQYQESLSTPTGRAQMVLGSNLAPTIVNSAALDSARSGQSGQDDEYGRRIGLANVLRSNGLFSQADATEQAALKFKPEFDQTPRVAVGPDGKPFSYVLDKSGNIKRLDGVLPRDEMKLADLGGRVEVYNPYSIMPGQAFEKSMTKGEQAANSRAIERLNFDKEQAGRPVFSEQAGGFVSRPTAANPAGSLIPLQGFTPKQPQAPVEFSKSAAGLVELQSALNNYQSVIDEIGGTRVSPTSNNGAKLKAAFTGVQMGLKNAMELGALAGPDVEILGGMLVDPTSVKGLMYGASGVSQQIGQTRKYLDNRTQAVEKVFGRKVPTPEAPEAASAFSVTAPNGKTYTFSNAKDLANFKLSAGIR